MNFLQKLYDKLAFQKRYDEIKAWKLPPEVETAFDYLWTSIPSAIQASVMKMLKEVYNEYGEEFAVKLLKDVLERLRKMVAVSG